MQLSDQLRPKWAPTTCIWLTWYFLLRLLFCALSVAF
jgi:hypothetical protein